MPICSFGCFEGGNLVLIAPVVSDLVEKHEDRFSRDADHLNQIVGLELHF